MQLRLLPLALAVAALALSPAAASAGAVWSAPATVIPSAGPSTTSAPQAFVSPTGRSLVLAGSGAQALLAGGDAAGVFAPATPVATASGGTAGIDSAIGPDGTVAVAWTAGGAGHVSIVKPGGDVLSQNDLPGTGVNAIGVGIASDGSVIAAYRTKESASSYSLRVAVASAATGTFGEPVTLESPAATDSIDVATGPGGAAAIAYRQLVGKYRARVAVRPAGASAFEPGQPMTAIGEQADYTPQVAFDADGSLIAAWGNPDGALYALRPVGASAFGAGAPLGSGSAYSVDLEPTPQGGVAAALSGGGVVRAALQAPGGAFSDPVVVGPTYTSQFTSAAAVTTTPAGTVTVVAANPVDGDVHAVDAGGSDTLIGYGVKEGVTPVAIASSGDRTVAAWTNAAGDVLAATRSESAKPAAPGALGPKPAAPDRRAPKLRYVSGSKRFAVTASTKSFTFKIRCDEACKASVTGSLRTQLSAKSRRRIAPLPPAATSTTKVRTGIQKVTIKLGGLAQHDLRAALRTRHGGVVYLVLQASDAAGNTSRVRLQLTLRPAPKKHGR
jgi:hypothetical protein